MYVYIDYKTKKEFIAAVKAGVPLTPYNPSGMWPAPTNGTTTVEGPHYPKPHKWYSAVVVKNGVIVSAK